MPPKGKTPAPPRLPVASSDDDDAPGPDSTAISTQTPQWLAKDKEREREPETFSEAQLQQIAELFHRLQLQSPSPGSPPHNRPTDDPPPPPPSSTTTRLRASDIGFFDPENKDTSTSKTVVYTDVFAFTDMLLHLAEKHPDDVREAFPLCLRGTSLFWYSTELTTLERRLLSSAPVSELCNSLISRFKERPGLALKGLLSARFSFQDIRSGKTIRTHVQEMLRHTRSSFGGSTSEFQTLLLIYNSLDVPLRGDVDEPDETTTLAQFLTAVDSKWSLWLDKASRSAYFAALPTSQDARSQPRFPPSNSRPVARQIQAYLTSPDNPNAIEPDFISVDEIQAFLTQRQEDREIKGLPLDKTYK